MPAVYARRQWGAAAYTTCGGALNSLGVATVDAPDGSYPEGSPLNLLSAGGLTFGGTGSGELNPIL